MAETKDPRGKLKATTGSMLREHKQATMAVALLVGPNPESRGMQVGTRGVPGKLEMMMLVKLLRGLADEIEVNGGGETITIEKE